MGDFVKNNSLSFFDGSPANILLVGDNLYGLKHLLKDYKKRIKFIYIDPPYGSGGVMKKAGVDYDNFNDRNFLLSFLRERLELAKQLLRDDGIFYLHCDQRNHAHFKILCDEIFGENNFNGNLIWKKKFIGQPLTKNYSILHEYILVYCGKKFKLNKIKYINNNYYSNEYNGKKCAIKICISNGVCRLNSFFYSIVNPDGIELNPVQGWQYRKEKMDDFFSKGLIIWKENKEKVKYPYIIHYARENNKQIFDYLPSEEVGYNNDAGNFLNKLFNKELVFRFSKPYKLIKYLMSHSTDKDDIILDFFAGSGSTGHATLNMNKTDGGNRKFILCQTNEIITNSKNGIAYDVTCKVLKRIMTGECYDGTKPESYFLKNNSPYGGSLDVFDYIE